MKRNVLFFCVCIQSLSYAGESVPDRKIPSLAFLAWNTFKKNADSYRSIPSEWQELIDDEFEKYETIEADPLAFFQLADQLQAAEQKNRAAQHIAKQLYAVTRGKPAGADVRGFVCLQNSVDRLPNHLSQLVWKWRNSINDITGQFQKESP